MPTALRWLALVVRALAGVPRLAARGTARRVSDPARQVVEYWTAERSTIRQGFGANFISALTSLVSGVTLAAMDHRLLAVKGLYILIPVSIGMRGNIFGALSARLGTAIHMGLFQVSLRRGGILFQNALAASVLTLATSVMMGLLARAVAALLRMGSDHDGRFARDADRLLHRLLRGDSTYRFGYDPDNHTIPLVTSGMDLLGTICLVVALALWGVA